MTNSPQSFPTAIPECPTGHWAVCAWLGAAMIAGSVFILYNIVAASLATALFFAAAMIVTGIFQIAHSFAAKGWRSVTLSLIIGILFALAGGLMATNPLATSLGLTLAISAMMLASGVVRLVIAFRHWNDFGWLLLISGLFSIALAAVLIMYFPWSGLVVPGVMLGIDLMLSGIWWLMLAFFVRRPREGAGLGSRPALRGSA